MKLSYAVGDPCWIHIAIRGEDDEYLVERCPGRVVATIDLPDDPTRLYLIRLNDPDWEIYETRDALMMADSEDGLMPFEDCRR